MPSSARRRSKRQCTGANRKVYTFRWIGLQAVGVCKLVRAPRLPVVVREKAEDGAEKSFRRCKRKRCRGQRRGKRRSRGDKPRSSSPRRPEAPKGVSVRRAIHSGRKFLWAERRRGELCRSSPFRRFERVLRRVPTGAEYDRSGSLEALSFESDWPRWRLHLRSLRRRASQVGIPDGANPFEKSALDFLLTNTSLGGEMGFMEILSGLRSRTGRTPADYGALADREDSTDDDHEPPPAKVPARDTSTPVKSTTGIRRRGAVRLPRRWDASGDLNLPNRAPPVSSRRGGRRQ
jgi:hypothetical protein